MIQFHAGEDVKNTHIDNALTCLTYVWHDNTLIFAWAGKMFPRKRSFWSRPRRRMMMMNKWVTTHAPMTHGSWLTEYANVAKADDNADECTSHIAQIDEACWTYEKISCHTDQSVTPLHMSSYLICRWGFLHKKWDHLCRKMSLFFPQMSTPHLSTCDPNTSSLSSKSQLMSSFVSTSELKRTLTISSSNEHRDSIKKKRMLHKESHITN